MTRAGDIEHTAAGWLVRREQPDWSGSDEAALAKWLDESMAHKAAFWRLEIGWEASERLAATRTPVLQRPRPRPRPMVYAMAVAASLLLVCLLGAGALWVRHRQSPELVQAATSVGALKRVDLVDGSRITLNTGSAVRASVAGGDRQVWLDRGEAFFDVSHDQRRPFTVFAGDRKVTVLGTRFSIRRDGDTTIVTVEHGRVRVEDSAASDDQRAAVISAGDVAVARGTSILLAKRSDQWVEDSLSWREGILTFDQVTLSDAAREFNRYNKRQIRIADPRTGAIRIGGSFVALDIDAFARLLRTGFGLRVAVDGDTITIIS